MTRGLEIRVLEDTNSWSITGPGCESFAGVRCTGFVDMVFLWGPCRGGDGGGEEKTPGHVPEGRFSMDNTRFQTVPFFMLYVIRTPRNSWYGVLCTCGLFYILHTVRGVGGLGIRMLTLDTKTVCTSRIGGSKYRWSWNMNTSPPVILCVFIPSNPNTPLFLVTSNPPLTPSDGPW